MHIIYLNGEPVARDFSMSLFEANCCQHRLEMTNQEQLNRVNAGDIPTSSDPCATVTHFLMRFNTVSLKYSHSVMPFFGFAVEVNVKLLRSFVS